MIKVPFASGYGSESAFREAFFDIMAATPAASRSIKKLVASWIDTPLGSMLALGDDVELYLLEFLDRRGLEQEIKQLIKMLNASIILGSCPAILQVKNELKSYFKGDLKFFKTPYVRQGTPFQMSVWEELMKIPFGEKLSYGQLALALGKPTAFRAVAQANGANQLAIFCPCHRVINQSGHLGGYAGGLARKKWLLNHELAIKSKR